MRVFGDKYLFVGLAVYIFLSSFMLLHVYQTPYFGLGLDKSHGQYLIEEPKNPIYEDWMKKNNIQSGDQLLSVNNQSALNNVPEIKNNRIITARFILIQDKNGKEHIVRYHLLDIPYFLLLLGVFPTLYGIFSFIIAIYLMRKKLALPLMRHLIFLLLVTSLAYISINSSSSHNSSGIIINSMCMIFCVVLLCDFIIRYMAYLQEKKVNTGGTKLFYVAPFIPAAIICSIKFKMYEPIVTLTIFSGFLALTIILILYGFLIFKLKPLKLLFIGIVIPFFPILFLYALPIILSEKPIVDAEICALFLLFIPLNMITLHITERLFNLDYYISRIIYYGWISLFFVIWIIMGIAFLVDVSIVELISLGIFIFLSMIISLYVKEHLDFKNRSVLFTMKGNHMHDLYKNIRILSKSYTLEQSLQNVKQVVEKYLHINDVTIRQTDTSCEESHLVIGKMIIEKEKYTSLIHCEHSNSLYIDIPKKSIHLQNEQIVWLELFYSYVDNFLTSTKIIEELMEQLQKVSTKNDFLPDWLKQLIYIRVDEEKYKVAQELHDTILQKYYHIARQLNMVVSSQPELNSIYQQFIESITNLRTYCETLKPPLLAKQGLQPALEQLARKMALESEFDLDYSFDRLYLENEDLPLTIYRIIQELLNNAQKHAYATKIMIHLEELENGCMIHYEDNGVGFDIEQVKKGETFGLQGIQERVEAFNGSMDIMTKRSEGVKVHIVFEEEFIKND